MSTLLINVYMLSVATSVVSDDLGAVLVLVLGDVQDLQDVEDILILAIGRVVVLAVVRGAESARVVILSHVLLVAR